MKTNNPVIDNMLDAQAKAVNNWLDTTKKFQDAFTGGKIQNEAPGIYREWMEKQMDIFGGSRAQDSNGFNASDYFTKPEEFFRNWYARQSDQIKQMTEFNQNVLNGFVNYGKTSGEYVNNFNQLNNNWSSVYTNWMNAVNSTFETMLKNMPNNDTREAFKKFFDGNKVYGQLQEFWSVIYKSLQSQEFNAEHLKNMLSGESYKKVAEQMFSHFFQSGNMKDFFDTSMHTVNNFFSGNSNLSKEYFTAFQNMANEYPQLISGDFNKLASLFRDMKNVFEKSFAPVMNMLAPGKEKQNIEITIQLMDCVAQYTVKQAQFQQLFYSASQHATENVVKQMADKLKKANVAEGQSFNDFYSEWLKVNEAEFTKLYNSDQFSELKSDLISISADVKRTFEQQFQHYFSVYPVVFRSEIEELHKTIYDLKKQVKALEAKLKAETINDEKSSRKK